MDVVVVRVPANTVVSEPIVVTHDFTDGSRAYFPRNQRDGPWVPRPRDRCRGQQ